MATFNIEDAAFAGVGLLARRPLAALTWSLVWAILVALVAIPFAAELSAYVTDVAKSQGRPPTGEILPLLPSLGAFALLMGLGGLVVGAVVSCAVFRAMLEPEVVSFAGLRLGEQEIQVMLVNFARGLIIFAVNIALSILLALIVFMVGVAGPAVGGAFRIVGELTVACLLAWLNLRLCLAGPMTFAQHKFRLFESWNLTRGLDLRLIGMGVILFLMGVVVYLAVVTLGVAGGVALWNSAPRPADVQTLLSLPPSQWMIPLAPFVVLAASMVLLAGALLTPIFLAPLPFLYRSLTLETDAEAAVY